MSSIEDRISKGSENAFNSSRDVATNALRGTRNLLGQTGDAAGKFVGQTGDIASNTVDGVTRFAKNTLDRGTKITDNVFHGKVKGTVGASKDLLTGTFGEVVDDIEGSLQYSLSNPYISTTIKVLIALYAAFAAPSLPKGVAMFFDNSLVRILIVILIVYLATRDASMAILVSLAFIFSLQTANKYKLIDTSRSVSPPGQLSWLPSSHGTNTPTKHGGNENFVGGSNELHPLPHETGLLYSYDNEEETGEEGEESEEVTYPTKGPTPQAHRGLPYYIPDGNAAPKIRSCLTPGVTPEASPEILPEEESRVYPEYTQEIIQEEESRVYPEYTQEITPEEELGVYPKYTQEITPETTPGITPVPQAYGGCRTPTHGVRSEDSLRRMRIDETPDMGSNLVPGANQNSCVQTWNSEHCTQGLNKPRGYDENGFYYSQT